MQDRTTTDGSSLEDMLTEETLVEHAGQRSFDRGEEYYEQNLVYRQSLRKTYYRKRNFVQMLDSARW